MISEFTMSAGAMARPEFPNMLWRQITTTDVNKNEILNTITTDTLRQKGETELISRLQDELQTIAQEKVGSKAYLIQASSYIGIFTGTFISQYIALGKLSPLSGWENIGIGFLATVLSITPTFSTLPAMAISPWFRKIGGEIEKIKVKNSLNTDTQAFLRSECHMDFRESLV